MKKIFCALFLLFAFSAHSSGWADYVETEAPKKRIDRKGIIGFGAGAFFTDARYNDKDVSGGGHISLSFEHYPFLYLGWGADIGYMGRVVETRRAGKSTSFESYYVDAMVMFRLPFERVEFYGGAGGALFANAIKESERTSFDTSTHSTGASWAFKGGVRLILPKEMFLGLEGRHYRVNADKDQGRINSSSVLINYGLTF